MLRSMFISLMFSMFLFNVAFAEVHNSSHISAGESVEILKVGNKRFVDTGAIYPHQTKFRRTTLTSGQNPFAIIISCADSRVPPEVIFDQGLGDLFVIRNAGNVVDEDVIASVEYAVAHLGTPLVVVLGHQNCGAVSAAIQGAHDSPSIKRLVKRIKPAVDKAKTQSGDLLDNAIRNNIDLVVNQLKNSDPIIADAVKAGKTKVIGAYYSLDTGKVEFIN